MLRILAYSCDRSFAPRPGGGAITAEDNAIDLSSGGPRNVGPAQPPPQRVPGSRAPQRLPTPSQRPFNNAIPIAGRNENDNIVDNNAGESPHQLQSPQHFGGGGGGAGLGRGDNSNQLQKYQQQAPFLHFQPPQMSSGPDRQPADNFQVVELFCVATISSVVSFAVFVVYFVLISSIQEITIRRAGIKPLDEICSG